ncbi:toxin-activating lysine-acyltransferase [Roseateles chitinivorans]|uniref:toxin-activating lysine-acyltransferase n=1 Tax=Roseateles chitinivorans TaxID=2917965 RepID=UPI003D674DA4
MTQVPPNVPGEADMATARRELAKLPLLGPVAWLLARDQQRRFNFFADIDWRYTPPLVLDQCKLYNRSDIPWAFVSWAWVDEAVDQRLRGGMPTIAPHEWKSGPHLWFIDVLAPFGGATEAAQQALQEIAGATKANFWLTEADGRPRLTEVGHGG